MKDIVYHVGDFKKRAETMYQLSGGRSTGFFGTGYYFCTDWELCSSQGGGHRPLYSFNVKGLNLLYGFKTTHDALKQMNSYMNLYPEMVLDTYELKRLYSSIESTFGNCLEKRIPLGEAIEEIYDYYKEDDLDWEEYKDIYLYKIINDMKKFEDLKNIVKELESKNPNFKKIDEEFKIWKEPYFNYDSIEHIRDLQKYFDFNALQLGCSVKKLSEVCEDIFDEYENYWVDGYFNRTSKTEKMDSFPTMILKRLGYQGVYPSKECDNIEYGGVIFDYDDLHGITLLADDVADYKG